MDRARRHSEGAAVIHGHPEKPTPAALSGRRGKGEATFTASLRFHSRRVTPTIAWVFALTEPVGHCQRDEAKSRSYWVGFVGRGV